MTCVRTLRRGLAAAFAAACAASLCQCYFLRGNEGGGELGGLRERDFEAADVVVPDGYRFDLVVAGLTFPTGIAFDDQGRPHVVESGWSPPPLREVPRLVRLEPDGRRTVLVEGRSEDGPWNGVAFRDGAFWITESGSAHGGRILRVDPDGTVREVVTNLPSYGDHGLNGPAVAPDGTIVFGIGTATNSGVVGEDNAKFGWLARHPDHCDIPGQDVVLTGQNFETADVTKKRDGEKAKTGAFVPFGTETRAGQVVPGRVPCTGGVFRLRDGGEIELIAWGFRNPYGLAFDAGGALYVTDNGYDERGSRPVWGAGELLWRVEPGAWYGFPDFSGDRPLTDDEFDPPNGAEPKFLLQKHPNRPPKPAAVLAVHGSADGFDFSRNPDFGHAGEAFVAMFGDQTPTTGELLAPTGFKVVRVNVQTGAVHEFAANRGDRVEPASKRGGGGIERPIAVRFDPTGTALWVVDFGIVHEGPDGSAAEPATGCVWRIERRTEPAAAPAAAVEASARKEPQEPRPREPKEERR